PPQTEAALRLQLECQSEMTFDTLALDKLRFFLSGEAGLIASLYELLFNHTIEVAFRSLDPASPQFITLKPEECISQVGFETDEGLLPYPNHWFLGYGLLTEFFAFPSKFLFLDLGGWARLRKPPGFGGKVEVILFLNRGQANMEQGVNAQTFRLGCTPVINLFEQVAEPIPL